MPKHSSALQSIRGSQSHKVCVTEQGVKSGHTALRLGLYSAPFLSKLNLKCRVKLESVCILSQVTDKKLVCTGLCVNGPAGKYYQQTPCLTSSFLSLDLTSKITILTVFFCCCLLCEGSLATCV